MARQYVRSIVGSVQRVVNAISPSRLSSQPKSLPGSPKVVTLAWWICRSYSSEDEMIRRVAAGAIANLAMNGEYLINQSRAYNFELIIASKYIDGTSHYLKGLVFLCCYVIIGACFFVLKAPLVPDTNILNSGAVALSGGALAA
ncbi:hypothetical protein IFM89_029055 [Coptis chinensis]|uniref:Uncharacterized protein n=1 Tax=Coptis chinensis TaxID=261450 RepID=A0A835IFZ4_9MAGN|nr:hypothetical protein IFM89_029055 [Coptis chinensis]